MSIVDEVRTRNIVIQTDQHQVFVHENFIIENNCPLHGLVKIRDVVDDKIYWFNFNAIVYIGPR